MKKKYDGKRNDTTEFKNKKWKIIYGNYPKKVYCLCGCVATEIHHKDMNHKNNEWNNLIAVCRLCHMKYHYPTIKRLIPYNGGAWRKNKIILEMVRRENLTIEDMKILQSKEWGKAFIDAWFKIDNE